MIFEDNKCSFFHMLFSSLKHKVLWFCSLFKFVVVISSCPDLLLNGIILCQQLCIQLIIFEFSVFLCW